MEDYTDVADDEEQPDDQPSEQPDDGPEEWHQMNVRVRKSRYEEWKQAVGKEPDDQFRSMSELVRYAVEQQVSGDAGSDQTPTVDVDAEAIADKLAPKISTDEHTIEVFRREINALRRQVGAEEADADLTRVVYNLLPTDPYRDVELALQAARMRA